jgi:hypothetical protein
MGSDILDEVLNRRANTTLYHYTNQAGLLGIIKNREIWATHTQYLNDSKEYRHAVDVVTDLIIKRLTAACDSRRILEDMSSGLDGIEGMNVCVCSFSEDGDSLSQWRAYGGPTSGYAIGFKPLHLAKMVKLEGFYLTQCIYEPTEQVALMEALVAKVFAENMERIRNGETLLSDDREEWIKASKRPKRVNSSSNDESSLEGFNPGLERNASGLFVAERFEGLDPDGAHRGNPRSQ